MVRWAADNECIIDGSDEDMRLGGDHTAVQGLSGLQILKQCATRMQPFFLCRNAMDTRHWPVVFRACSPLHPSLQHSCSWHCQDNPALSVCAPRRFAAKGTASGRPRSALSRRTHTGRPQVQMLACKGVEWCVMGEYITHL